MTVHAWKGGTEPGSPTPDRGGNGTGSSGEEADMAIYRNDDMDRHAMLDALRGFAVLGIYWINICIFALPTGAFSYPAILGFDSPVNQTVWVISELFVEGTMRGLFSMLFGAGALILLRQVDREPGAVPAVERYFRRNLLLMLFGLIHGYLLLSVFDVLFAYGLLGLFLFSLRKLRPWALLALGVILLAWGGISIEWGPEGEPCCADVAAVRDEPATTGRDTDRSEAESAVLPERLQLHMMTFDVEGTEGPRLQQVPSHHDGSRMEMQREMMIYLSDYATIFAAQVESVSLQESQVMYDEHLFDMGGMMLIGMALLHWGVLNGGRSRRFYALMAIGGYLLGGFIRGGDVVEALTQGISPFLLTDATGTRYDMGRLPVTLGHIGLMGLMCASGWFPTTARVLAAVGRLSLTHYISQTVFSIVLFYGFGFGLFGRLEPFELIGICMAVWLFQILFSLAWLSRFRLGPLEWLWRLAIHGRSRAPAAIAGLPPELPRQQAA